jgi:hypothetical protein
MKLEDQVCSLELAKRLKELGVRQESSFYWSPAGFLKEGISQNDKSVRAFTVAELGELLPSFILNGEDRKFLYCYADDLGYWRISYAKWGQTGIAIEKRKNEADARALMLIYLLENKP